MLTPLYDVMSVKSCYYSYYYQFHSDGLSRKKYFDLSDQKINKEKSPNMQYLLSQCTQTYPSLAHFVLK